MSIYGLRLPRPTLDQTYLQVALVMARRATCLRRAVGCVLVDAEGKLLSTGYNGTPHSEPHCIDHACEGAYHASGTGLDLCEAVNAEQNAIAQCPDVRRIFTAYVTVSPCISCVKLFLNTSCNRIVFIDEYSHTAARDRWLRSITRTWEKVAVE